MAVVRAVALARSIALMMNASSHVGLAASSPRRCRSFLGSLTGSTVGLLALLIGALFNAHLNRRRDEWLRKEERRGIATALHAELASIVETLEVNAAELRNPKDNFIVRDAAHSIRVMPEMLSKVGVFDTKTI